MKQTARIIRNNVPYTLLSNGIIYGEPVHVPTVADARLLPDPPPAAISIGSTGSDVTGSFYWDSSSVLADDGVTVIKVTAITTGRYRAVSISSSGGTALSVSTIANLKSVSSATLTDTQGATVLTPGSNWVWSSSTGAGFASDDVTVVKPNDVLQASNGRWYNTSPSPVVPTIAALRLAVSGKHSSISVQAYSSFNDLAGGIFDYDSSDTTTSDNGGTVVVAGTKRYKRRFTGALNVKWFGAKGDSDGTAGNGTDDTSAIQSACDAVTTGGAVYFPPGTYRITSTVYPATPVTISTANVRLFGEGEASKIFVDDAGDGAYNVSSFNAITVNASGCRIEKLSFVGSLGSWTNVVNSQISQRACIYREFLTATNTKVDRCKFYRLRGHTVHDIGGPDRVEVTNCHFEECLNGVNVSGDYNRQTGNTFIRTNGTEAAADHMLISDNLFVESAGISVGGHDAPGAPNTDIVVIGNTIVDADLVVNEGGSPVVGITAGSVTNAIIANNTIRGCGTHGISILQVGGGPTSGPVKVIGNRVYTGTGSGHGIWYQAGDGGSVVNNDVESTGGAGLLAEASDLTIDGNSLNGGGSSDLQLQLGQGLRVGDGNKLVNGTYTIGGATVPSFTQGGYTQVIVGAGPTNIDRHATTVKIAMNGACAIVLPDQSKVNHRKRITVINVGGQLGTTTISCAVGTIDGAATYALTGEYRSTTFESDGLNVYHIIARKGQDGVDYLFRGSGTPEAAVTAPIGSLYLRTDGGAGTSLYVKESGTGNTGWIGK